MPKKLPTKKELADLREFMNEMTTARLEMFRANAARYAEVLGEFRTALEKSGFSSEEAMEIILKVAGQPGPRPMLGGGHGPRWRNR
jgi:hypothetical protein